MKEAMPYLNIYPTEEIPADMVAEVEAEQAAQAEQEGEGGAEGDEGAEEGQVPEGSLVDPQTGETVQMPDPDEIDENAPYLGGAGDGLLTIESDTSQDEEAP